MPIHVTLCPQPFNAYETLAAFEKANIHHNKYGAQASFIGRMRDFNDNQDVVSMELEHYPGMTEKELHRLAALQFASLDKSAESEPEATIAIYHRVGKINPSDDIVIVAVWSMHRQCAFDLCRAIMEDLKSKAPFWKKEVDTKGEARWLSP